MNVDSLYQIFEPFLLLICCFGVFTLYYHFRVQKIKEHLQNIAYGRNGKVYTKSYWSLDRHDFYPQLEFQEGDVTMTLHSTPGTRYVPAHTHVNFEFSKRNPNFVLSKESLFHGLKKFFGAQDVILHNPTFDDFYVLKSDDEDAVRQFFNRDFQEIVISLKGLNAGVTFWDGQFTLSALGIPSDQNGYNEILDAAGHFLHRLREFGN